jgi:hypothetical protein
VNVVARSWTAAGDAAVKLAAKPAVMRRPVRRMATTALQGAEVDGRLEGQELGESSPAKKPYLEV